MNRRNERDQITSQKPHQAEQASIVSADNFFRTETERHKQTIPTDTGRAANGGLTVAEENHQLARLVGDIAEEKTKPPERNAQ